MVTCHEGKRHDLEDGEWVRFHDVKGMTELNNREFQIKTKGPSLRLLVHVDSVCLCARLRPPFVMPLISRADGSSFYIGDTSNFGDYMGGGEFVQVKKPFKMNFVRPPSAPPRPTVPDPFRRIPGKSRSPRSPASTRS